MAVGLLLPNRSAQYVVSVVSMMSQVFDTLVEIWLSAERTCLSELRNTLALLSVLYVSSYRQMNLMPKPSIHVCSKQSYTVRKNPLSSIHFSLKKERRISLSLRSGNAISERPESPNWSSTLYFTSKPWELQSACLLGKMEVASMSVCVNTLQRFDEHDLVIGRYRQRLSSEYLPIPRSSTRRRIS